VDVNQAIALALVLAASPTLAETTTNAPTAANSVAAPAAGSTNKWAFSVTAYGYLVPDSRDYVQPTVTADHGWLHLEGRYNYENLDTGSAWVGYNFGGGDKLAWQFTPMVGGIFGDTDGVAPGYEGSLTWWKLELYSEGEYVVDTRDSSQNYFYNWSQLTLSPWEWLQVGMVTQRTLTYQTDRDLQRGLLVGLSYHALSFSTIVFNPDESKPTIVLSCGVSF
jgi:hypothetical protein